MPESRRQFDFEIVLTASPGSGPVVLRSAAGADEATLAFAAELRRLRAQRARGELAIRHGHDGRTPLLRQPLSDQAPVRGTTPAHP